MLRILFCLICSCLLGISAQAQAHKTPLVEADSYVLVDRLTNTVLAEKKSHEKVNPGNTVQLMILYIVEQEIEKGNFLRDDFIKIPDQALSLPSLNASRFYLELNKTYSVDLLEQAVASIAANDAAIALAIHCSGSISNFVERMNQTAQQLGMVNTHYVSPIGINNKEQVTSAQDTLILVNTLLNKYPNVQKLWAKKQINNGMIQHKNTNSLLWYSDAVKGIHASHSHLNQWSYISHYSNEFSEDNQEFSQELIAIALQSKRSHAIKDVAKLVSWGADNYKTLKLYSINETVDKIPVKLSNDATVRVTVDKNLFVTLPRAAILQKGQNGFKAHITRMDPLVAPIHEGDKIGTLHIFFNGKEIAQSDLFAQHDVQQFNFFRRLIQKAKALFGMK